MKRAAAFFFLTLSLYLRSSHSPCYFYINFDSRSAGRHMEKLSDDFFLLLSSFFPLVYWFLRRKTGTNTEKQLKSKKELQCNRQTVCF